MAQFTPLPKPQAAVAVEISPNMFVGIVDAFHRKGHPSSTEIKIDPLIQKIGRVGFFKYSVSESSSAKYFYQVKFDFREALNWDAEVSEIQKAETEPNEKTEVTRGPEKFEYRKCKTKNSPALPKYPMSARIALAVGAVEMDLAISESGTVENVKVISGNTLFVKSAVEYAKALMFSPTTLNGVPQQDRFHLSIPFKIEGVLERNPRKLDLDPLISRMLLSGAKLDSSELESTYQRGIQYWEQKQVEKAFSVFYAVNEASPKYKSVCFYLGAHSLQLGDVDSAKRYFDKIIRNSDLTIPFKDQPLEVQNILIILKDLQVNGF